MSGKILLVDDDEFVLEVRSRDLTDEGYKVITAWREIGWLGD